eukprot:scaffold35552_cov18-Prasinocladus_malaysianus.AAC.1
MKPEEHKRKWKSYDPANSARASFRRSAAVTDQPAVRWSSRVATTWDEYEYHLLQTAIESYDGVPEYRVA